MCSRELAFWQSHMPSVLFTKKLSVVVSLHKQTSWLPWRGFCTPRFQYLVQIMAAEGSSSRVASPPPSQLEWGESHSHFPGGYISGGPKSWTHQGWPLTLPGQGQDYWDLIPMCDNTRLSLHSDSELWAGRKAELLWLSHFLTIH